MPDARIFFADTRFEKMARRPGGVPREEALAEAQTKVDELKADFSDWLDRELQELNAALAKVESDLSDTVSLECAYRNCAQLQDVCAAMGYELVTFVARKSLQDHFHRQDRRGLRQRNDRLPYRCIPACQNRPVPRYAPRPGARNGQRFAARRRTRAPRLRLLKRIVNSPARSVCERPRLPFRTAGCRPLQSSRPITPSINVRSAWPSAGFGETLRPAKRSRASACRTPSGTAREYWAACRACRRTAEESPSSWPMTVPIAFATIRIVSSLSCTMARSTTSIGKPHMIASATAVSSNFPARANATTSLSVSRPAARKDSTCACAAA